MFLFLLLFCLPKVLGRTDDVTVNIRGIHEIAETDDNYICATLDWWPPEKCSYGYCPWGKASIINLDLKNPILAKAVQAFGTLRIRVGGSLQDQVIYNVGLSGTKCNPFTEKKNGLFKFSDGCLNMDRWDELNLFFNKTRAIITFGLNALYGRQPINRKVWEGAWDSRNARNLMEYTISKGYSIDSWEFGNELSGAGIEASVGVKQYAEDVINLKRIITELYKDSQYKPLLLAPGGFFDQQWYMRLLQDSKSNIVDVLTHHIYNLGPGNDPGLVKKILDPDYLTHISDTFRNLQSTIEKHGPWSSAWVGEAGGAYNSGGRHVSDTFVNSFWYLDQLGMASKYNTKVYCRQSLIGGNYGFLDTTTFVPNPDYYSALLWNKLMGKKVLRVDVIGSKYLRAYAHCSKQKQGVTLIFINLSKKDKFLVSIQNEKENIFLRQTIDMESSSVRGIKKKLAWIGRKLSNGIIEGREEYHLTAKDGNILSQIMVLNGRNLELSEEGDIPPLEPILVDSKLPVFVDPLSIVFVSFSNIIPTACSR